MFFSIGHSILHLSVSECLSVCLLCSVYVCFCVSYVWRLSVSRLLSGSCHCLKSCSVFTLRNEYYCNLELVFRGVFRGSALRDSMTQNSVDLYLASPGKYMVYFLSNLFYQHLGEPRSLKCSSVGLPVLTLLRSVVSWVVALSVRCICGLLMYFSKN